MSGALALSGAAPADRESEHAARGTACHQIAEKCLRSHTGLDASHFVGKIEKTQQREVEIDEELADSAQLYVDYCRAIASTYWIEERFSLSQLNPPFDAGGTGDFVNFDETTQMLEIVDLKNGMGVVDAKDNPQLRTYALGAMLQHRALPVRIVKVTIVQPRAPHKEGRIRSEEFHIADLADWTRDLLAAMRLSKRAIDEYAGVTGELTRDAWADKWLRPGKCKFCPAEGFVRRCATRLSPSLPCGSTTAVPRILATPQTMRPRRPLRAIWRHSTCWRIGSKRADR